MGKVLFPLRAGPVILERKVIGSRATFFKLTVIDSHYGIDDFGENCDVESQFELPGHNLF
jgi:hypothetical protein